MKIGQIQPFPSSLLNTFVTPFIFYLKHSINLTNAEIICFSFYFHADFLVHYPENQQTHGSPFGHFYAKIVAMDKIIKTISESGAFRAFVLD
ncbi:MAG: redox-regulated molecular chaperone Hsp33, partial [Staphylococcus hominis]